LTFGLEPKFEVRGLLWLFTSGFLNWVVWAFVHVLSLTPLTESAMRTEPVAMAYFTVQCSSRLIPSRRERINWTTVLRNSY
jgi:hypothetical protein